MSASNKPNVLLGGIRGHVRMACTAAFVQQSEKAAAHKIRESAACHDGSCVLGVDHLWG